MFQTMAKTIMEKFSGTKKDNFQKNTKLNNNPKSVASKNATDNNNCC